MRTLFVEASARIMGDVAYETISIDAGALIEGRLARRAALGLEDKNGAPLIATPVSFTPAKGEKATPTAAATPAPCSPNPTAEARA